MTGGTITGSGTTGSSSAIQVEGTGSFTMNGTTVSGNKANNGDVISGNTAGSQGGGIYIDGAGEIIINEGDFYDNKAKSTSGDTIGTGESKSSMNSLVRRAVIVGNSAPVGSGI